MKWNCLPLVFSAALMGILFNPQVLANTPKQVVTLYIDQDYPPYSYLDKGRLKGIYVNRLYDIFQYLSSFQVELKPVPWQRGKKMMQDGTGLALTPPYFHGHDWPYLYPYSLAYSEEVVGVVCQNKSLSQHPARWPQDYLEYSFASVIGYDGWGGEQFRQLIKSGKLAYTEVASSRLLLQMILNQRVDCILIELNGFHTMLAELAPTKESRATISIATEISRDDVYVGFSAPAMSSPDFPYARQFQKELDIAIYRWKKAQEPAN